MMERMRRLRVRSTQPDLRGSRETLPGPTMWVRPATGGWGRMNAGESPRNQGRSVWPPLSVSRRRSRDLRKTPQWSAARRAGPRHGPAVPSRWRDRLDRKVGHGVRRSAPAPFGAPLPHVCEGDLPSRAEGMEMPGAPRALREQGRRSFDVLRAGRLKCKSNCTKARSAFWRNEPEVFGDGSPRHL